VRSLTPIVRDALNDRRVRSALDETYGTGRRVYAEVRGADAKDVVARMARDEALQHELGAMVRSAARLIDEGVSATRRHLRRRIVLFVAAVGGIVALVATRRRTRAEDAVDTGIADASHGAAHHGIDDAGIAAPATATPAASGLTAG
jgi:hypothetical protein